jgi:hypothetical protein
MVACVEPIAAVTALSAPPVRDLAYVHPGAAAREQAERHAAEARANGRLRFFLQRMLDVKTDERAWWIGAQGEEAVGARLHQLEAIGWHALHAVPVGERGSDIDHVVVGPGGVFTINTKTHPGANVWVGERAVMVNGAHTDYLRNSRFEAKRTARLLAAAAGGPVHVQAVIAVGAVARLVVRAQPPDVTVISWQHLDAWLARLPARLSTPDVEALFGWARLSTTWLPSADPAAASPRGHGRRRADVRGADRA